MVIPASPWLNTAVRAEPKRLISGPATSPSASAPSGMAAMALPSAAFDSDRSALISG
jgi:hypothetical protein